MASGSSVENISLTIGTAGHVDHGKTTLVRYLTGTDTDRLDEEHERGISIVPGYAELTLPGGRRVSLVDVPGHERFVKNMVAGSTGVDAFLLVVAADDGVMPQTREHLDVLRILGVERGVVALTKPDAVDEETASLAELDAEELLESTGIEARIIRVSGATGEGTGELLAALDELAAAEPGGLHDAAVTRLPVDRAFVLKGIGLVATGTLWSGEIQPGATLYTASGRTLRVRGVQNHGRPAEAAHPGARTALDVTGIETSDLTAGEVLLSRPVAAARVLDVRLRLLESAAPLVHGTRLRLYHGTRSTNARVRLPDTPEVSPGGDALARLVLEEPLVALPGDRVVLRSLSPQITTGGGTVLDADPTSRRPDLGWLAALESGDLSKLMPLAVSRSPAEGITPGELSLLLSATPGEIAAAAPGLEGILDLGGIYAPAAEAETARERLLGALGRRAEQSPESPELTVAEARNATGLGARLADAVIRAAGEAGEIHSGESGVSLPDADAVPEELEREAQKLAATLRDAGAEPPDVEMGPAARLLIKRDEAVQLSDKMLADSEKATEILQDVKSVCLSEGEISLAGLRDRIGTSRKYAQAWLEYADSAGITRRTGDVRVLTRRHRAG
ncbi:selenocysteine-specific translation elongation factor [Rubrobacter aplysinae]|uniref:selenocysteine-specific translation elongation factor n=1 Tax=Rubrobacter aplysinae TaxID=909625 RepID=UPI00064C3FA0|nr:selenocysteine-specific translation elongation factor [Rubrobacter aplysinae]